MNFQSQTFKIVVIMLLGAYLITWSTISIQNGVMYKPPPEYSLSAVIAMILQIINGTVGKYIGQQVSNNSN